MTIAASVIAIAFGVYIGWWSRSVYHTLVRCREAIERLSPRPLPEPEPTEAGSSGPAMAPNIERLQKGFD